MSTLDCLTMRAIAACLIVSLASLVQGEPPPQLDYGLMNLPIPKNPEVNPATARSVKLLGDALRGAKGLDRVRYARDIGEAQRVEGLDLLRPLLKDDDPLVRQQAIASIGMILPAPGAGEVRALLTDPVPAVRRQAVLTGAALGDASFAATGLNDPDEAVFIAAMGVVAADQAGTIVARLPSLSPGAQVVAMAALGRLKHKAGEDVIGSFLDRSLPLKIAAIKALANLGAPKHASAILGLLGDPHPSVRREAVLALHHVADLAVRQNKAIELLKDADPAVRQAACTVLRQNPTPAALAVLAEQLPHEYKPLHDESRNALLAIGTEAIPTAVSLLDHASPARRIDGSWLLGKLKTDAGLARHLQLLKDKDWTVVSQAAESLGYIGRADACEPLMELLATCMGLSKAGGRPDAATYVSGEMAIVSAVRLKHRPVLQAVKPMLFSKSFPPNMRAAAAWAMGMMAGEESKAEFRRYIDLQNDELESSLVQGEGLKALGNARVTSLLSYFLDKRAQLVETDWLSHWVKNRLEGQTTDFNFRPVRHIDLSVVDRP